MKKLVLLVFALNICLGTFAQFTPEDTLKYRISLKDKAATDYSLQKPEMSGSGFGFMRSRSTAAITSFSFFRSASMDGGKFTSPASLFSSSMSAGPLSVCVCLLHFIFPQLFMIVNWTLSASFMRICPSFIAIFIVGYFLSV